MTVYDSLSGREIQNLPAPETMDGVHYDANLKRVYVAGGRWYGTPDASPGWIYLYNQKDPDHYEVASRIKTRRVRALLSSCRSSTAGLLPPKGSGIKRQQYWCLSLCDDGSLANPRRAPKY